MRLLSILTILGISSLNAPAAYAYPEHPAFEHTQFAEDFGMFRWWESCWWRVFDPNIYVLCQPDGDILLVYPDGSVHPASEEDLTRLFASVGDDRRGRSGANRLGLFQPPRAPQSRSPRLSPAQGDGFRLSDVYGGRFTRFDGSTSRFPSINLPSGGTGVFSFDGKSLKEIMKIVSRWYDVEVFFLDKKVETTRFVGVIRKNRKLEDILINIKNFGIIKDYEINDKRVILK